MQEKAIGHLTTTSGKYEGHVYQIISPETTLGRDANNTIALPEDTNLSRHHCRIFEHVFLPWIEDSNSSNGTFLARPGMTFERLIPGQPALLLEGCQVRIGACEFELSDLSAYQTKSLGEVGKQLQEMITRIGVTLPDLPDIKKTAYRSALQELESHLLAAQTEQELMTYLMVDIHAIAAAFLQSDDLGQTMIYDSGSALPPLPEDFPDEEDSAKVDSIRNIFISDIKRHLPPNEEEESE